MVLLCLADIHGEAEGLGELLSGPGRPDVVVVAGDITHLGGRLEAEQVLAPIVAAGIPLVAVAGNMDREAARGYLAELGVDLHGRGVRIGEVGFMGLGGGTPSPFRTPWEIGDEEAERCLAAGLPQIAGAPFKVLVSHPPPHGTDLDRSFARVHVGSAPVRRFLDGGPVGLCICGHIHESAGIQVIGPAPCVNVGPYKSGNYALVTIEGDRATVTRRTR
jgi:Icc-related predicted phosphoesterase